MADNTPSKAETGRLKSEKELAEEGYGGDLKADRPALDLQPKSRVRPNTVSRPPSSHITRVDEEPSGTDGSKTGVKSVETVDRGVGPTPLPPTAPSIVAASDTRLPQYLSFQPFPDPRNGLLDAYAASLPYGYSPYGCAINPSLPLNPSTLEGRYHWPPISFPQTPHGLPSSPTPSDVSLLTMRSPMLPGEHVTQLASRIHWEHLQRNYYHTLSSRRLSPASLPGIPLVGASPLIADYPPPPSIGARSLFSDVPPTPGSGSITLPGSLESSRLTSPRPSIVGGKSRKRALSHSPISDLLDIQSLTRSSEGSLQLASFLQPNSRSSSAASGSYGHLSAASVGTVSPGHPLIPTNNPYLRQNTMAAPPLFYSPHFHSVFGRQSQSCAQGQMLPPSSHGHQMAYKLERPPSSKEPHISTTTKEAGSSSIVSSTMDGSSDARRAKVKKECENRHIASVHPDEEDDMFVDRGDHIPQEGEPDFMETNCHWVDCHQEFDSQDELVKHINQDHIQSNKKSFVCRWSECSREEKPFKAQYMLVVHMRRHTGEKPHRCTFEGCTKAYSRLENLKTHLRSHTGEKPYMCEFPGCTKAFSNASDRAKHQNRTHSNAKPYVCKAVGCTKRYTDPSSLRKHVKTVHGPDFYANKKHKGDGACHVKKEDPEGDNDSCDINHKMKMEDSLAVSSYSGPPSGDNQHNQDAYGSAPSSHSQPSPQSSPEVNVTCGLDQGQLIEDRVNSSGGNPMGLVLEEEEVIIPESNEAEIPGSSALLIRGNMMNAGYVIQNRLKGRLHSKGELVSPLSELPSIHNPGDKSNLGEVSQVTISEITQRTSKGNPQHKRITDIVSGEQNTWRENSNTLLPASRRESNTSTLSSYMSSMRSDAHGSTFSSRRSSGASRLSIANSPYEYDITGNLPNPVSRRSSGESSTNIGSVSALMQKANLGSHPCLGHPPTGSPIGSVTLPPIATATAAGAAGDSTNTVPGVCSGSAAAQPNCNSEIPAGCSHGSNRYYNDNLARYFSTRKEIDGIRTSTPSFTPLPHEIPNREIRRASDPVRTKDPNFESLKSLQRCHSLNMVKPLPTPPNMKSLQSKAGSTNTFHSSRSSIATDISFQEQNNNQQTTDGITDAELEEKMLEDSEDMIIPDDMQRFLETYEGENSSQRETRKTLTGQDGADGILEGLGPEDGNFPDPSIAVGSAADTCNNADNHGNNMNNNSRVFFNERASAYPASQQLLAGNLQVQTGFADLHPSGISAGITPHGPVESFQPSPHQRHNFTSNLAVTSNWGIDTQPVSNKCSTNARQTDDNNISGTVIKSEESKSLKQTNLCCPNYNLSSQSNHVQDNLTGKIENVSPRASRQEGMNNVGGATKTGVQIVGQQMLGYGPMPTNGQNVGANVANLEHGVHPTQPVGQWGVGSGGGAYLSQHNLMQHQLHQQQLHQQQLQQHQHEVGLPSNPMPHYHTGSTSNAKFMRSGSLMPVPPPIPQGGYSPMPPPSGKPASITRGKRGSPQVQVPHISQSQIPANAKAANRNQALIKQQSEHQQQPMIPCSTSHPQHQSYTNMMTNDTFPGKTCPVESHSHMLVPPTHPLHQQSPYQSYPLFVHQRTHNNSFQPLSMHPTQINPNPLMVGQNVIPPHPPAVPCNTYSHLYQHQHHPSQYHIHPDSGSHPSMHSSHAGQPINSPHPSMPGIPISQASPCHQQGIPGPSQYPPNDPYNPMEMSPGCNQVTSSTDCKETNVPPIEDFMDNLTSISTENLMENINSISQENIMYSPTPASLRTASQNSGRFNSLMNTSNMVVNDMSSVLTQLAEENKYLNLRP